MLRVLLTVWSLYPSIATSQELVNFDEYGNKYCRIRVESNSVRTYQMSIEAQEYIYILLSNEVNYELIHVPTNFTFDQESDGRSRHYYLLQPQNTQQLCSSDTNDDCTFKLIISNTGSVSEAISLRFNKNIVIEPEKVYKHHIKLRKRRRYAMQLHHSQLPIAVTLTPNQRYNKMDIDLYAYTQNDFTSYYFPNRLERNHINNYREQLVIVSADSYYRDEQWHFFEIYGSTDSEVNDMDYEFEVLTNYEPDFVEENIINIRIYSGYVICLWYFFIVFLQFPTSNIILFTCSIHAASKWCIKKTN